MEVNEKKIIREVTSKVLKSLYRSIGSQIGEQDPETEPETMKPTEAQKKFGIPEATIRHLVRTKRVLGKTGKPFLVNVKSLRAFIEQ